MRLSTTSDQIAPRLGVLAIALAVAFAILALPDHQAGTALLLLIGAVVAWLAPEVMVGVVIVAIPIQDAVLLPLAGSTVTLTQVSLAALAIGWAISLMRRTAWLDGVTWWFGAILAALLLSAIAIDGIGDWAGEVYRWGVAALFYLVCRSVLRSWAAIRIALGAMIVAVCAVSAFGLGQVIARSGPEHMMRGGMLRAFATFGTPNPFAAYMEFTVPLLLAVALIGLHREPREQMGPLLWLGSGVAGGLGCAMLALTQSRGGWVGFAAAMVVLLWVLPMRTRIAAVSIGAVLIFVVLMTPPGQSQLARFEGAWRLASRDESVPAALVKVASTGRESLWGAAAGMFVDYPLTGVGAGEFDVHYRDYTTSWHRNVPLGQAHNGYLHMAAQAGLAGAVAFAGWLAAMLLSLMGAVRAAGEPLTRALALGALAIIVAFGVHSVVDYLNVLSLGLQLSAVVAIGLNIASKPRVVDDTRVLQSTSHSPLQAGNA